MQETGSGTVLDVRVSGKLSKADYERFVPDFRGWELGALWEDIKFDLKHFGDIERLAMVGDKKWEEWMAKFCGPFTKARIRYFDQSEADKARSWIAEG